MCFLSPRKLSLCWALVLLAAASSLCAQTMHDVFIAMPDSVEPLLSRNNRLDLVDFVDSHMRAEVDNALDGKSRLLSLSERHCMLQSSAAVRKEFLLLPYRGEHIVLAVSTFASPANESELRFYTTNWQALAEPPVVEWPEAADFFIDTDTCDAARLAHARGLLGAAYISATIQPDSLTLTCTLSLDNLSATDKALVAPYVSAGVLLKWTGEGFRRQREGGDLPTAHYKNSR